MLCYNEVLLRLWRKSWLIHLLSVQLTFVRESRYRLCISHTNIDCTWETRNNMSKTESMKESYLTWVNVKSRHRTLQTKVFMRQHHSTISSGQVYLKKQAWVSASCAAVCKILFRFCSIWRCRSWQHWHDTFRLIHKKIIILFINYSILDITNVSDLDPVSYDVPCVKKKTFTFHGEYYR